MSVIDREQVEAKIMHSLREIAGQDTVTRESRLEDLDVTSLDLIEVAQILEEEYDIQLLGDERMEEETPARPETVGEVVDALTAHIERAVGLPHA